MRLTKNTNDDILGVRLTTFLQKCNHVKSIIRNNEKKMNIKIKSILMRFLKGIIAGAVASMSMVTITQPTIWADFGTILNSLGIACVFGAITGLLLALQKWASWTD